MHFALLDLLCCCTHSAKDPIAVLRKLGLIAMVLLYRLTIACIMLHGTLLCGDQAMPSYSHFAYAASSSSSEKKGRMNTFGHLIYL